MCRQNLLYGGCLLAFGLGVLLGAWMKSGFVCNLIGLGLIGLGVCVLRRHGCIFLSDAEYSAVVKYDKE